VWEIIFFSWPVKLTANEVLFLTSLKKGIKYLIAKRSQVV
jgi:hypothetical protein